MYWGADNAGNVLIHGEWWRIVTAMFVHVGILHLATNMWCLWNLGLLAEPLMGSAGVLAVYILTGAAGNLLSTCQLVEILPGVGKLPRRMDKPPRCAWRWAPPISFRLARELPEPSSASPGR